MIVKFKNFVTKHNLFDETDKILLSVSGGRDSIVLMKLFAQAGFVFGVAHCNYHLRGEESNRDERFVRDVCKKYSIHNLHIVEFDTEKYAIENKISIEMAARNLRYEWYRELCKKEGYTRIATAHHLNDQCETFFINLLRSTGINGIRGIPVKREINNFNVNGKKCFIIRPLMFLSRKDIDNQVNDNEFVDDYTNFTDKYTRNIIRHNIIPKLDEIQNNFPEILNKSIEQFDCTARFIEKIIPSVFPKTTDDNGNTIITIPENFDEAELQGYLYFMLNGYGFNLSQIKAISQSRSSIGSLFYSSSTTLLIDRQRIIIKDNNNIDCLSDNSILIDSYTKAIDIPLKLEFSKVDIKEIKSLKVSPNIALLDYEKLIFPLEISLPREGETFMPLGMRKHKKISDFYIDKKVDYFTKCCTFAVRTDGKIAWLTNMRIDERFKITNDTKIVYKIEKK